MSYLIKTIDKLIGNNEYPINSNLLELKNNRDLIGIDIVNNKLSGLSPALYNILKLNALDRYIEYNSNTYELALKIVEDNSDFYYESSLWTDNNLLNEYNYDKLVNSKYECYINKPFSNMILILNDKEVHIHLSTPVNSLKELFTNGGTLTVDEFILYDTVSPFGFNRIGEIYNVQFSINYYIAGSGAFIKYRMAILLNNIKEIISSTGDWSCSAEGLGLHNKSLSDAGGLNIEQSVSSGCLGWFVVKEFADALLYIN